MVVRGGLIPYRPEIPKETTETDIDLGMIELMKQCWEETPEQRPDFNKIIIRLKVINKGKYVFKGLDIPDSKVHGASMGLIWGRQDRGGPHVGPMNFAIWDITLPNSLGQVKLPDGQEDFGQVLL